MSHAFISYVRDNNEAIQKLSNRLEANGVKVWLDRNEIKPGFRWEKAIKDAIQEGAFFIACFSKEYLQRSKTYMNEELTLAIEHSCLLKPILGCGPSLGESGTPRHFWVS